MREWLASLAELTQALDQVLQKVAFGVHETLLSETSLSVAAPTSGSSECCNSNHQRKYTFCEVKPSVFEALSFDDRRSGLEGKSSVSMRLRIENVAEEMFGAPSWPEGGMSARYKV